jgi:hypothetical protein
MISGYDEAERIIQESTNHLVVVTADDWEGLFVNGKLIEESHKLGYGNGSKHVLEYAKNLFKTYDPCTLNIKSVTKKYYDDYLSQYGRFPNELEEVDLN